MQFVSCQHPVRLHLPPALITRLSLLPAGACFSLLRQRTPAPQRLWLAGYHSTCTGRHPRERKCLGRWRGRPERPSLAR